MTDSETTVPTHQRVAYDRALATVRDLSEGWLRRDQDARVISRVAVEVVEVRPFDEPIYGAVEYVCRACQFVYSNKPERCIMCGCEQVAQRGRE